MFIKKIIVCVIILTTCLLDKTLSDLSTSAALPQNNSVIINTTSGTTSVHAPQNGTISNSSTSTGKQIPKYWQDLLSFLQNLNFPGVFQDQIGNFIQSNNVSFPISILTPENLQKVLLLQGPAYSNLQGLSQYAGQLANIPDEIRNFTDELEQGISPQCYGHLQSIVSEVFNREQWAIKMIDAAGKIQSGLLDGNLVWPGSYDECLAVHAVRFDGKYCSASLPLTDLLGAAMPIPGGVTVKMGICIPDSCTSTESKTVLDLLFGMVPIGKTKLKTSSVECSEPKEYDAVGIAGITVVGLFAALMLLSTMFDLGYQYYQQKITKRKEKIELSPESKDKENMVKTSKEANRAGTLARLAMAFSVYTNGKKLLNTEQGGGALSAINGIRFLSISWVVLGHAFAFGQAGISNKTFIQTFFNGWPSMVIANALLSVDSFFTLSGLLVSYLFMKEMKREKGRINWFMFYFHRFWRLTPAYMLVLFLEMSLFRYAGDGPFFLKDGVDGDLCRKSWWTNILYINNVVKAKEMCFNWSWYLANDMQFYVVSPLLLVPLYFSKKIGLAVNVLALLVITIVTAVISSHYRLLPTITSTDPALMEKFIHYFFDYYIVPWCRMGPYIVGIVTGYIIYRTNGDFKISKELNLLIWVAMTVVACVVVYGISDPVTGSQWDNGISALYNALHRSVWGMCVCWVIFACVTGNGGLVNNFLSWKLFVPLGRLSYCIYLTHPLVIYYYLQVLRKPFYATNLEFTYIFLGSLVLSILTAIVATLTFETPMMVLEKIIFRRGKK
ncbi:nose resistant to fluoxetine protein 6-like [Argopecten irradians]|uniref:nose resistant to fluoxetine protein 6-like n=1 Tax=Argopecten irradians TaxID=31199 RepID=UPI00371F7F6B